MHVIEIDKINFRSHLACPKSYVLMIVAAMLNVKKEAMCKVQSKKLANLEELKENEEVFNVHFWQIMKHLLSLSRMTYRKSYGRF